MTICSLPSSTSCFGISNLALSETELNCSDTNEVGASHPALAWTVKGSLYQLEMGWYDNLADVSARMHRSSSGRPKRPVPFQTSETSARLSYQPISNWYRRTLYCPDTASSAGPSTTCMFQTVPGFMYMHTAREPHCIALWPCHICNHHVCR